MIFQVTAYYSISARGRVLRGHNAWKRAGRQASPHSGPLKRCQARRCLVGNVPEQPHIKAHKRLPRRLSNSRQCANPKRKAETESRDHDQSGHRLRWPNRADFPSTAYQQGIFGQSEGDFRRFGGQTACDFHRAFLASGKDQVRKAAALALISQRAQIDGKRGLIGQKVPIYGVSMENGS